MSFDAFAHGASPRRPVEHAARLTDRGRVASTTMTNARQVAYRCLQRIDHEGAYANLLLPSELGRSKLSERDRGFVTELVYGTTRMRRACDALVDRFVIKRAAARAAHAAAARCLPAALRRGRRPRRGRRDGGAGAEARPGASSTRCCARVDDTPMVWPNDAVRLSYPDWIVERLRAELGDEAERCAGADERAAAGHGRDDGYSAGPRPRNGSPPRSRPRRASGSSTCVPHPAARRRRWPPAPVPPAIAADRAAASRQRARSSERAGRGRRRHARRRSRRRRSTRCWSTRRAAGSARCAAAPTPAGGSQPADVAELAALQRRIIDAAAPLVRPGGWLVYSVCTLTAAESIDHPVPAGFEPIDEPPGRRVASVRARLAGAAAGRRHRRHGPDSVPSDAHERTARSTPRC